MKLTTSYLISIGRYRNPTKKILFLIIYIFIFDYLIYIIIIWLTVINLFYLSQKSLTAINLDNYALLNDYVIMQLQWL